MTSVGRARPATLLSSTRALCRSLQADRRQTALTLHRNVAQDLAAAQLQLALGERNVGKPHATRTLLRQVGELLRGCSKTVQALELALRPPLLEQAGLVAALNWLAREESARGVPLAVTLPERFPRFDPAVEAEVYQALATFFRRGVSARAGRTLRVAVRGGAVRVHAEGRGAAAVELALGEARARLAGLARASIARPGSGRVALVIRAAPSSAHPTRRAPRQTPRTL